MISTLHKVVWGPWTMVLFLAAGMFFTVRSRFFQIRGLRIWWRETFGSLGGAADRGAGGISRQRSACTALAATIGTGNIAGVATALTAGGPGAVVWMWISAAIGMMLAYAETFLGISSRYRDEQGAWVCGPMVYMEKMLDSRFLSVWFCASCIMAACSMGSMVQANAVSSNLQYAVGIPPWFCALLLMVVVLPVINGGIGRIAGISGWLIPVSAGIYVLFSMTVILSYHERIPAVLAAVFQDAFGWRAVAGGTAGYALSETIRYGMARGIFSNEAGLGSLAMLHGAAEDTTPQQQGMWAIFEVFVDTIVICSMTALVILCVTNGNPSAAGYDGAALTAWCFGERLGSAGEVLVTGAMTAFAYATILAWYYPGQQAVRHLIYKKSRTWQKRALAIYRFAYLAAACAGCVIRVDAVWETADIWNGLMAYPNLAALIFLSGTILWPEKPQMINEKK